MARHAVAQMNSAGGERPSEVELQPAIRLDAAEGRQARADDHRNDPDLDRVEQARVERITQGGLLLDGVRPRHADLIADCTGFASPGLARTWGLSTTAEGRMAIDDRLRSSSDEHVFGAGDGAAIDAAEAAFIRMACATAMPLGAHAASFPQEHLACTPNPY